MQGDISRVVWDEMGLHENAKFPHLRTLTLREINYSLPLGECLTWQRASLPRMTFVTCPGLIPAPRQGNPFNTLLSHHVVLDTSRILEPSVNFIETNRVDEQPEDDDWAWDAEGPDVETDDEGMDEDDEGTDVEMDDA